MKRKIFLMGLWLLAAASPGLALEQSLDAGASQAFPIGGTLENLASKGAWTGGWLSYGLRLRGRLGAVAKIDYSTLAAKSASSLLPLKLAHQSIQAGLSFRLLDWGRWRFELEARGSIDKLREKYFPQGAGGPSVLTRTSGWGVGGGVGLSRGLGHHFEIPIRLGFHYFSFDGPLERLDSSRLGLELGLRWRP